MPCGFRSATWWGTNFHFSGRDRVSLQSGPAGGAFAELARERRLVAALAGCLKSHVYIFPDWLGDFYIGLGAEQRRAARKDVGIGGPAIVERFDRFACLAGCGRKEPSTAFFNDSNHPASDSER